MINLYEKKKKILSTLVSVEKSSAGDNDGGEAGVRVDWNNSGWRRTKKWTGPSVRRPYKYYFYDRSRPPDAVHSGRRNGSGAANGNGAGVPPPFPVAANASPCTRVDRASQGLGGPLAAGSATIGSSEMAISPPRGRESCSVWGCSRPSCPFHSSRSSHPFGPSHPLPTCAARI